MNVGLKKLNKWSIVDEQYITVGKVYRILASGMFQDDRGFLRSSFEGGWSNVSSSPRVDMKPTDVNGEEFKINYDDIPNAFPKEQAMRFNAGKPQLSYMLEADVAMKGMCGAFAFGAIKYERMNWKKGLPVIEIMDSLLRHMMAVANGEVLDADSGLPHVDHITCNAVFLATFGLREEVDKGPDTRDML